MEKKFIEIDGARMSYVDVGTGFPVILGHSYLWSAEMWKPQVEALAGKFRVIVPELWGHGESEPPPTQTESIRTLADQHLVLLDTLGVDKCHLVGLSVGGMWGAQLAVHHPERIDHLVLMDTYLGAEPETTRQKYYGMLDAASAAGYFTDALLNAVVPMFFHAEGKTVPQVREKFRNSLKNITAERIRQSLAPMGRLIFGRADFRARISELASDRTIVICGDQDIPRPPKESHEMAQMIGCLSAQIPAAGHISSLENPSAVNKFLLKWLPCNS